MKIVKRWRYDCDFCKKTGGSKFHMKNHEEICTANPDRKCGFCRIMDLSQQKLPDLVKIIESYESNIIDIEDSGYLWLTDNSDTLNKKILEELRHKTEGCPACMLAAIRQTTDHFIFNFDYKEQKEEFWSEYNAAKDEDHYTY